MYLSPQSLITFDPSHAIEDYRVAETGIQYSHLANGVYDPAIILSGWINPFAAPHFRDIQLQVAGLIQNKILVGHSLWNFLSVCLYTSVRQTDNRSFR
jgi:RNA exonuclease 4